MPRTVLVLKSPTSQGPLGPRKAGTVALLGSGICSSLLVILMFSHVCKIHDYIWVQRCLRPPTNSPHIPKARASAGEPPAAASPGDALKKKVEPILNHFLFSATTDLFPILTSTIYIY